MGQGSSHARYARQTLLSATESSSSSSSSWNLSQLLPESTAYTIDVRRPTTVEGRRFVQMGLEANAIARELRDQGVITDRLVRSLKRDPALKVTAGW